MKKGIETTGSSDISIIDEIEKSRRRLKDEEKSVREAKELVPQLQQKVINLIKSHVPLPRPEDLKLDALTPEVERIEPSPLGNDDLPIFKDSKTSYYNFYRRLSPTQLKCEIPSKPEASNVITVIILSSGHPDLKYPPDRKGEPARERNLGMLELKVDVEDLDDYLVISHNEAKLISKQLAPIPEPVIIGHKYKRLPLRKRPLNTQDVARYNELLTLIEDSAKFSPQPYHISNGKQSIC